MIAFKLNHFVFDSPWCKKGNRGLTDILIPLWMGTLVRAAQITSNPFLIVKPCDNQSLNEKKFFYLHFILRLRDPDIMKFDF